MSIEKDAVPRSQNLAVKKIKFDLAKFMQQWNTLDSENYANWPISIKITFWLLSIFIIFMLGYFIFIQPTMQEIDQAQQQQQHLLDEFQQKDSKLRNLQQYQTQLATMRSSFKQQLAELPKESEISGLVEDIHRTGVKAGLKFKNIILEPEVQQVFFIEQPILIEATGDYHAFGSFTSALALLTRIVTLHDFVIQADKSADQVSNLPIITYSIQAKTYRYVENNEPEGQP